MSGIPYQDYDAIGLAELIRNKEVQPVEIIEAAIRRIEALNPEINAVVYDMYDKARAASRSYNPEERGAGGPFAGVPILIKNINQDIGGEPLTSGSAAFRNYRPAADSEFVRQLRKTDVILMGITNVPEFGLVATTEPVAYGPTRNPWNIDHTPGGSSGGSAAAVASGMVPIAGANDGGGSIRIPAAYTGLFGLKPTRGRTPVGRRLGRHWQGASVDHVLTRTVRDSAAMLDELKTFEKGAAFHALPFEGSYLQMSQLPLEKRLRVAFSVQSPIGTDVDPEHQEAVKKTAKMLEALGHIVEEKEAPVDGDKIAKSYLTLYFGEVAATLASLQEVLGRKARYSDVEPTTWLLGLLGRTFTAEEFVLSIREWDRAAYAMEDFHEQYDVYLTPTTAYPPARIGELAPKGAEKLLISIVGKLGAGGLLKKMGIVDQIAKENLKRTPFTQLANLTGQPSMSVPLHQTSDGLPIGVQFTAARGREDLLFQLAGMLEQSSEWVDVTSNPFFQKEV